jgi:hypothetical protein
MARYVWLLILLFSGIVNAQPAEQWTRSFRWPRYPNYVTNMTQFGNGNFLLSGRNTRSVNGAYRSLRSLDSSGDSLWVNNDGGRYSIKAVPLTNGNCLLFGRNSSQITLCEINSSGDTLSTHSIDWVPSGYLKDILPFSDRSFLVYGELYQDETYDVTGSWALKLNAEGINLWYREYPFRSNTGLLGDTSMVVTADEGFLQYGVIDTVMHVTKCDASGDVLWTRTYDSVDRLYPNAACITSDNGFVLAGFDAAVSRFSMFGDVVWSRRYTLDSNSHFWDIKCCRDGGFVVSGDSIRTSNSARGWLLKIDAAGDSLWSLCGPVTPYGGMDTEPWESYVVQTADSGYLWTINYGWYGSGNFSCSVTKIAPDVPSASNIPASNMPSGDALYDNYPNPFNPSTTIAFDLPKTEFVSLKVFDLLGREVAVLSNGVAAAGHHSLSFDGSSLASGIYFYRIQAGEFSAINRMLLLK